MTLYLFICILGGKDSLVVWHQIATSGKTPLLMYVSDGLYEYHGNWRLPEIVRKTGNEVIVIKHIFVDETFIQLSRSYLEPCGHPWAGVVLFDALLVKSFAYIF
jgi:hypothetical protein